MTQIPISIYIIANLFSISRHKCTEYVKSYPNTRCDTISLHAPHDLINGHGVHKQ